MMANTKQMHVEMPSQFTQRKSESLSDYFIKHFIAQLLIQIIFLSFLVDTKENKIKMRREQLRAKAEVCDLFIIY